MADNKKTGKNNKLGCLLLIVCFAFCVISNVAEQSSNGGMISAIFSVVISVGVFGFIVFCIIRSMLTISKGKTKSGAVPNKSKSTSSQYTAMKNKQIKNFTGTFGQGIDEASFDNTSNSGIDKKTFQ